MTTEIATSAKISYWGICPICLKERRIRKAYAFLVMHRRWIKSGNTDTYGHMAPCPGSGNLPLPTNEKETNNG